MTTVEVVIQRAGVPALVDQGVAPRRAISGVRNQPERLSGFDRNGCPLSIGISVRFRPDYTGAHSGECGQPFRLKADTRSD
jgi:hypothetical protein